jgi:hypothetical protein
MKLLQRFLLVTVVGCSSLIGADFSYSGNEFTPDQVNNYKLAYEYGQKVGGYGLEMMGILYAESTAGEAERIGDTVNAPFKRSYGIMQVKLGTYHWTQREGYIFSHKKKLDEEILFDLIHNNNFNTYVAAGYFKMMKDKCKTLDKAISAYNRGHCREVPEGITYRKRVKEFMYYAMESGFENYIKSIPLPSSRDSVNVASNNTNNGQNSSSNSVALANSDNVITAKNPTAFSAPKRQYNQNTINNMVQYQSTHIDMAGAKIISKYP